MFSILVDKTFCKRQFQPLDLRPATRRGLGWSPDWQQAFFLSGRVSSWSHQSFTPQALFALLAHVADKPLSIVKTSANGMFILPCIPRWQSKVYDFNQKSLYYILSTFLSMILAIRCIDPLYDHWSMHSSQFPREVTGYWSHNQSFIMSQIYIADISV